MIAHSPNDRYPVVPAIYYQNIASQDETIARILKGLIVNYKDYDVRDLKYQLLYRQYMMRSLIGGLYENNRLC